MLGIYQFKQYASVIRFEPVVILALDLHKKLIFVVIFDILYKRFNLVDGYTTLDFLPI